MRTSPLALALVLAACHGADRRPHVESTQSATGASANGPNYSPYEILTPQAQDQYQAYIKQQANQVFNGPGFTTFVKQTQDFQVALARPSIKRRTTA